MTSIFFWSWLYLGMPCLLALAGLGFFSRKFRLRKANIFRGLNFPAIAIGLQLAALIFGVASGYFAAWIEHRNDNGSEAWYDKLAIVGAPGDAIANEFWGDWQSDEAWYYRDKIAGWNGVFWTTVGLAAVPLVYFPTRRPLRNSFP